MTAEIGFDAFVDFGTKLDRIHHRIGRGKPIFKTVSGSALASASPPNPLPISVSERVSVGRIWNILQVNPMGTDPHTSVSQQIFLGAPAVPASTVAIQNTNTQLIFANIAGGVVTAVFVNGIQVGSGDGTYAVPIGGAISITYSSAPTWTWTSSVPTPSIIDVYASSSPDSMVPPLIDVLQGDMLIPSSITYSSRTQWCLSHETIYGLIYNPIANQEYSLVIDVADYAYPDVAETGI